MTDWKLPASFDFNDREVRYGVIGEGPPLVVVHGTPWSSFNMRHLIQSLSQSFSIYYYDLPGYGQSDMSSGDVSLGMQNDVLAALLDHWGLKNPLILGHDFGGTTVLRTHLINGCSFEKIVLIDAVALSPWGSPFFRHIKENEQAFAGTPDYIHEAIVRAYINTAATEDLDDAVMARTLQPWLSEAGKPAFYRQIAQASSIFTDEIQPHYHRVSAPVQILWGLEDSWIPVDQGQQLHNMIPTSTFHTIPGAGHLVIEEQPAALLDRIQPFLSGSAT